MVEPLSTAQVGRRLRALKALGFDGSRYADSYLDLPRDWDEEALTRHLITHGLAEGRIAPVRDLTRAIRTVGSLWPDAASRPILARAMLKAGGAGAAEAPGVSDILARLDEAAQRSGLARTTDPVAAID